MLACRIGSEIKVWNLDDFTEQYQCSTDGGLIWSLEWMTSNNNLCIVTGCDAGYMKVWEMESARIILSINNDSCIYAI